MKQATIITILCLGLAVPGFAQMGGGGMGGGGDHGGGHGEDNGDMHGGGGDMGGMGGGMMGAMGGGMIVVADDDSVLIKQGHGMVWNDEEAASELINIAADGSERWSVAFDGSMAMMPETAGDLVVLTVSAFEEDDDWHGGGHMGSPSLVALDLASGVELWTFSTEDVSMLRAEITDDGSIVYVVATIGEEMGSGPMGQGETRDHESTLYALDRFGDVLWSLVLE